MDKAFLRREFLQKRMNLTVGEIDQKSSLIAENVVQLLEKKPFNFIHVFLPQRNKAEIDTWKIISSLRSTYPQIQIIAPFVISSTREMEHYLLSETTTLVENRWGIPEPDPKTSKKIHPQLLDVILIPLLAFDKTGMRVGYGGGFYDRFLVKCRPDALKIGLSFFDPVAKIEGLDEMDVRMDACVLPKSLISWY